MYKRIFKKVSNGWESTRLPSPLGEAVTIQTNGESLIALDKNGQEDWIESAERLWTQARAITKRKYNQLSKKHLKEWWELRSIRTKTSFVRWCYITGDMEDWRRKVNLQQRFWDNMQRHGLTNDIGWEKRFWLVFHLYALPVIRLTYSVI